jgi:hypothetical protein
MPISKTFCGIMFKPVSLLGFLAVLTAANLPGSAKAWDGCYYRPCDPRYDYYPRNYGDCCRRNYYPRYYTRCRWCDDYRYDDVYGGYRVYHRRWRYFQYDEWYSYDW